MNSSPVHFFNVVCPLAGGGGSSKKASAPAPGRGRDPVRSANQRTHLLAPRGRKNWPQCEPLTGQPRGEFADVARALFLSPPGIGSRLLTAFAAPPDRSPSGAVRSCSAPLRASQESRRRRDCSLASRAGSTSLGALLLPIWARARANFGGRQTKRPPAQGGRATLRRVRSANHYGRHTTTHHLSPVKWW